MSELNNSLLEAYDRGYKILKDGTLINPKGDNVNGSVDRKGYRYTSIRINGKVTKLYFHRYQAFIKFGDKMFEDELLVRHLNGDSLDNSFSNIQIGTNSDNMMDKPEYVRKRDAVYASSFIKVHNHEEVYSSYLKTGSYKQVMNKFNISSTGTLHYIINKVRKAQVAVRSHKP